jgi:hypothetical protein
METGRSDEEEQHKKSGAKSGAGEGQVGQLWLEPGTSGQLDGHDQSNSCLQSYSLWQRQIDLL